MKYKLLGKSGLRVSEICLGTMTFGEEWAIGTGKDESKKIYDAFLNAGGNFIDTANRYTEGSSEKFLGEFIPSERNNLVIATKYTLYTQRGSVNDGGNHRKNLAQSIEGSLKRLNTEYVDLLYLHAWDFTVGIEEVLRNLQYLVQSGKVLHIAISDTPAWIVAQGNAIAELRGWSSFVAVQAEYSLTQRTPERDIIPMCRANNVAVTAWAPLAGGALTGKYLNNSVSTLRLKPESLRLNQRNTAIAKEVVSVANELGCSAGNAALNWIRKQNGTIIPIVGARKVEQIKDNLNCLNFDLTGEQMIRLNEISKIDLGFPHDFLTSDIVKEVVFGGTKDNIQF
ncbi:MAG: aldo/keto reductase [Ignavibacteria bacterium CG_4_8_14_3_um_filter_37_9]|nr:MAG: aldo/keto reductase [Ignavibacteria bacterium CG08_land_8_20_14_0_20_37_9]PIW98886.1 MAG: aldo/keto reductase [Ignavibacteria bacterium CG_4_8_14_3_um_filter_37_9]